MFKINDYNLGLVAMGSYHPTPQQIQEMARELLNRRMTDQYKPPSNESWSYPVKS